MQVICTKENLNKGLNAVNKAVATKIIMPVLSNILFNATPEGLILTATDLEIGVEVIVEAEIQEKGSITLPAKLLTEIISKLPEAPKIVKKEGEGDDKFEKRLKSEEEKYKIKLILNEDKSSMHISCAKSDYHLQTLPAEDFPSIPRISGEKTIALIKDSLSQAIKQTKFSTSTEVNKGILNGIHLRVREDKFEMVATDGYRLSMKTWSEPENKKGKIAELDVTIPYKSMAEFERILHSCDDSEIHFAMVGNHAVFQMKNKLFSSRILEGTYPDYNKIIPKVFERKIKINKQEFLSAVERVAVVASEITNVIKVILNPEAQEMAIKVDKADLGSGVEIVEIECDKSSEININFNARFLIDALRILDGSHIIFALNGEVSPVLLYNTDDKTDDTENYPLYLCMIMPIRPQSA